MEYEVALKAGGQLVLSTTVDKHGHNEGEEKLSFSTHLSCIISLPSPCLIFLHDTFLPFSVPG